MSVQPDFRSLLTEIDLILSRVVSSLVSPQDVSVETIESAREQLERVRERLLLLSTDRPSPTFWRMGIEATLAGVRVAFFRERDGAIDLYPLSWSLEDGESELLPPEMVDRCLVDWLTELSPDEDSWLYEALQGLSGIWIAGDGETPTDGLKSAMIATKISTPDRIHSIERTIATALAHVSLDPQSEPETLVVIQGGREITEIALLEVPIESSRLSRRSIALSRLDYGEETFTRDLLARALYPRWAASFADSLPDLDGLAGHPLGRSLLEAARLTKLILQERSEFTSRWGDREWTINRTDVEDGVVSPFTQLLIREVEGLLAKIPQNLTDRTRLIFSGDFFLSVWPLLSPALTAGFSPASIVPPPSPGTIPPVLLGLGRVTFFPAIEDRNGNND